MVLAQGPMINADLISLSDAIRAELWQHLPGPRHMDECAQYNNCCAEANKKQSRPSHRRCTATNKQPPYWLKAQTAD